MNVEFLRVAEHDPIVSLQLNPYMPKGLRSVELMLQSGRVLVVRSKGLEDAPFEACTIDVNEELDASEGTLGEVQRYKLEHPIASIEVFGRTEYLVHETGAAPANVPIGMNAYTIETGPMGSAPADSIETDVTCGIALYDIDMNPVLLISLSDYFEVLDWAARSEKVIAKYRESVSSQILFPELAMSLE